DANFSRDGRFVVTGSDDGTARVWDAATGEPVGPMLLHNGTVIQALFSPDGKHVLTGDLAGRAKLWSRSQPPTSHRFHHHHLVPPAEFLSEDGKLRAVVEKHHLLWTRNSKTGEPLGPTIRLEGAIHHVSFSLDGRLL